MMKYIANLPVGAMAVSTPVRSSPGTRTTGVTSTYVSVTLGGIGSGKRVSTSPPLISLPPGAGVRPGYNPGAGVMLIMSGKGVVLAGTAPSSSPAKETRLHKYLTLTVFIN